MKDCIRRGVPLKNNPKFPFRAIRPLVSQVLYLDKANYVERNVGAVWIIHKI